MDARLPELRQLAGLVALVQHGSFTRAAAALHQTQSALSKQIAQLETRLGRPLLVRGSGPLRLTDAGEVAVCHARQMLAQGRALLAELDDLDQHITGELRLALPMFGADALFTHLIVEYVRRYPDVRLQLEEAGSKRIEQALLSGEWELGAALTPSHPELAHAPFCDEPLDVLAPVNHPCAQAASVTLAALADTPFLLYERSFTLNDRLLQACHQAGFTPREAGRSGQADFLATLVAAGQGVVLLPRLVARGLERPGLVRLTLGEPAMNWDVAFIWRREGYLSRAARAWLALAQEMGRVIDGSAHNNATPGT